MLLLLLYAITAFNVISTVSSENGQTILHSGNEDKNRPLQSFLSIKPAVPLNMTYIDRAENMLRVPNIKKPYEKTKGKMLKKTAKRTIQKIIKKNRSKRKFYLNQVTNAPTRPPPDRDDLDSFYAQEEMAQKNDNFTTTQGNHKKKNFGHIKVNRYPMPFKKLQSMKDHKRVRRNDDREDLFILTDLDEIEFLNNNKDKDTDVVNAHVKKYW